MKSLIAIFALALVGLVSALAVEPRDTPAPQTVHLTFHGGPAQYSMAFPADGVKRDTSQYTTYLTYLVPPSLLRAHTPRYLPGKYTLVNDLIDL